MLVRHDYHGPRRGLAGPHRRRGELHYCALPRRERPCPLYRFRRRSHTPDHSRFCLGARHDCHGQLCLFGELAVTDLAVKLEVPGSLRLERESPWHAILRSSRYLSESDLAFRETLRRRFPVHETHRSFRGLLTPLRVSLGALVTLNATGAIFRRAAAPRAPEERGRTQGYHHKSASGDPRAVTQHSVPSRLPRLPLQSGRSPLCTGGSHICRPPSSYWPCPRHR